MSEFTNFVKLKAAILPKVAASLLTLGLVACGPGFAPDSTRGFAPLGKTTTPELNEDQRADQAELLVAEGEKLISAYAISEAFGKFNEARSHSASHPKARFWLALLKPVMKLEGIHKRIKPVFMSLPNGDRRYRRLLESDSRRSHPELRRFMHNGPEDIQTSDDVQEWMDQMITALEESRVLYRELIDEDHDLIVNFKPGRLFSSSSNDGAGCSIQFYGPIRYESVDTSCGPDAPFKIGMSSPEFRFLLFFNNYMQLTFEFFASYTMDGTKLIDLMSDEEESQSGNVLTRVMHRPGDGKQRRPRPFSALVGLSADSLSALQYAHDRRSELCPDGSSFRPGRKGYMAGFQICIDLNDETNDAGRAAKSLEALLAGDAVDIYSNEGRSMAKLIEPTLDGKVRTGHSGDADNTGATPVSILPLKLVEDPIKDLNAALAFEWDACGNIVKAKNDALAPYFAEGSLQDVIDHARKESAPCRTEVRP